MITVQTESKPLKPCPFCAGSAMLVVLENENVPEQEPDYLVICKYCGAEGPCADNPFKAEKWWNLEMLSVAIADREGDRYE